MQAFRGKAGVSSDGIRDIIGRDESYLTKAEINAYLFQAGPGAGSLALGTGTSAKDMSENA
jgi:hypothetical protein